MIPGGGRNTSRHLPHPDRTMTDDVRMIEQALAAAGFAVPGQDLVVVAQLPSLTNRAWHVKARGENLVVRLPGPGTEHHIDRRAEARNLKLAAARGVGAPVRFVDETSGVLVTDFDRDATVPTPGDLRRPETIARLGATLRRLHDGADLAGVMDPFAKIARYLATAGIAQPDSPAAFGALWPRVAALRSAIAFETRRLKPCHVDPVPQNILDKPAGLVLIDWEYAAMSEPLWDLAYAAVEGEFETAHKLLLLDAYGLDAGDLAELELWCAATMAVTAAWCVMQEAIGDDSVAFRAYKERRLAGLAATLDAPDLVRRLRDHEGAGRHAVL